MFSRRLEGNESYVNFVDGGEKKSWNRDIDNFWMGLKELYELFILYDFEQHFFYLPCDIRKKETTSMLLKKMKI